MKKMGPKTKLVLGTMAAATIVGFMKSGTTNDFAKIRKAYAGGISTSKIPVVGSVTSAVAPAIEGAFQLALKGSQIPVVGPTIVSPLVSGTYGLFWGWTY